MAKPYLLPAVALLDASFPLPLDRPFTAPMASSAGVLAKDLTALVRRGLLRRLLRNVYVAAQVTDSLALRTEALRLVVPAGAVVTDRTAGWLHGAEMILAPGDHVVVPPVSVFHRGRGHRLRNGLVTSGQRMMTDDDVMEINGICVTTPLRTACDLGRSRSRDGAFATMSMMLRLGHFSHQELVDASAGFRGYRNVRQLRALAPLVDSRVESPPEAVVLLRWLDCPDLPRPEPQRRVPAPLWADAAYYAIDLGIDELRFGVEYDGEEFHGPDRRDHDSTRREWITQQQFWILRVVLKQNVFGRDRDIEQILRAGVREARARMGTRRWV